jgi:hypothetical protein
MVKILIGLVTAVVVAAAGVFGFQFYMQQRVVHEVDAAFEQIRTAGGKVSHGKVAFDLWSRTVTIADIAGETATQPPLTVKIAGLTATGVGQPEAERFSAATIDATDVEITGTGMPGWRVSYKAPRIAIKDVSGPVSAPQPASSSATDMTRLVLERFASVAISSVTMPSMTGTIWTGATQVGSTDFTYTGVALAVIKNGNIAKIMIDRTAFTTSRQAAGNIEKLTGDVAAIALYDFDTAAIGVMLDPAKANDDKYYRISRLMTAANYSIAADNGGLNLRVEGMTADDIGWKPSRLTEAGRFSAATINTTDVEIGGTSAPDWRVSYKAPRLTIKDFSSPLNAPLASVAMSSVTLPSMTGTISTGAMQADNTDLTYTGVALGDIKNGNIAKITIDRTVFATSPQPDGKTEKLTGEIATIALYDFDIAAFGAMLDPAKANDDKYYRISRQMTAASCSIAADNSGLHLRIEGIIAADIGWKPSRDTEAARFSAATINATDLEIGGAGGRVSYKAPRLTITDFSGPVSAPLASVAMSSVTVPSMTGTISTGTAQAGSTDFTYTGVALGDIKNGNIAKITIDRTAFTSSVQVAGTTRKLTGEIAAIALYDFDIAAMFDSAKANDDKSYRISRQLTAASCSVTADDDGPHVRIEGMTAEDIGWKSSRPTEAGRFSAAAINATNVETGGTSALGWRVSYKAPQLTIKDFSAPVSAPLASVAMSSVTAPSITGTMSTDATQVGGNTDFTYTGVAVADIKNGNIAKITIDRTVFSTSVQPAGKTEKFTGDVATVALYDLDTAAISAMFDPATANEDKYYRLYRQMTAGSYSIAADSGGPRFRIEGMAADDIGWKPSRFKFAELAALVPQPGTTPNPAQMQQLLDKAAGLYESVRIGNAEMRGFTIDTPQGAFRLAAIRFNLENGKVGEFAIEGLDVTSPAGPVKIGRFAFKGFDVANMLRMSSQFATPGRVPSPDQFASMLRLLEGVEIKGVVAPYKNTGAQVNIDAASLNWGQFVGPIPSQVRAALKMSGPIDARDGGPFDVLAEAGMKSASISADLGAGWTEASRSFALEPVTFELSNVIAASARLSLANVPREVFSLDPQQALTAAAQIEAGSLELTLQDLGAVDLLVRQYARDRSLDTDKARRSLVEEIRADPSNANDPNLAAISRALAWSIENPHSKMTIKLTPKGKVPVMELVEAVKIDPSVALARFQVDASTER